MNKEELEQLGKQLTEVGLRRRELVEQLHEALQGTDLDTIRNTYLEFQTMSDHAINMMNRQLRLFKEKLG